MSSYISIHQAIDDTLDPATGEGACIARVFGAVRLGLERYGFMDYGDELQGLLSQAEAIACDNRAAKTEADRRTARAIELDARRTELVNELTSVESELYGLTGGETFAYWQDDGSNLVSDCDCDTCSGQHYGDV